MTVRGRLPSEGGQDIVVIKPSSLGDVVHTLPAVHCLKRTFPGARLVWIVNAEWHPVLDDNPDLNRLIMFPRRELGGWRQVPEAIEWYRSLRAIPADLVLDFQGLLRSAFMARMFPQALRFGLGDAREGSKIFYDRIAAVDSNQHAVERYLRLAELAGANTKPVPHCILPAGSPLPDVELAKTFVLVHPFARGRQKSLSPIELTGLCLGLRPLQVIVVGRSAQEIPLPSEIVSLINKTSLSQLIYLIRRAAFVVSVDSGPMHLAAAAAPGLLSIHFWTDPRKVGPYRPGAWVWKNSRIVRMNDVLGDPTMAQVTHLRPDTRALARFVLEQIG